MAFPRHPCGMTLEKPSRRVGDVTGINIVMYVVGKDLFGETALRFIEFAKSCGVTETIRAIDVEDAVGYAAKLSAAGDIILLSPACASWDQHPSFEVRGDLFIDRVMKL